MRRVVADGNGRFMDYRKEGSWILNQMRDGKGWKHDQEPQPAIRIDRSADGNARFARVRSAAVSVTASAIPMCITRKYRRLEADGARGARYAIKWSLHGAWDGITVDSLRSMAELVCGKMYCDLDRIGQVLGMSPDYASGGLVDPKTCCIKAEAILGVPGTVTDFAAIEAWLDRNGFDRYEPAAAPESPAAPGTEG